MICKPKSLGQIKPCLKFNVKSLPAVGVMKGGWQHKNICQTSSPFLPQCIKQTSPDAARQP